MNLKMQKSKWLVAFTLTVLVATLAYCASPKNEPDVTGTVFDVSSREPVEGAFVVATYYESDSALFSHSATWCVRTVGTYTKTDGNFRFPVGAGHPPDIRVIKPGYFMTKRRDFNFPLVRDKDGRLPKDSNAYLVPQDTAHPEFHLGFWICERPKTKEDVASNLEYLKIALAEVVKYGDSLKVASSIRDGIRQLESVPESNSLKNK